MKEGIIFSSQFLFFYVAMYEQTNQFCNGIAQNFFLFFFLNSWCSIFLLHVLVKQEASKDRLLGE